MLSPATCSMLREARTSILRAFFSLYGCIAFDVRQGGGRADAFDPDSVLAGETDEP